MYLGAYDVWVGSITKKASSQGDIAFINTPDESCLVPNMQTGAFFYNTNFTGANNDVYGNNINRINEGYIEVFEMGVLIGSSAQATVIDDENPTAHCSIITDAWNSASSNHYWLDDATTDLISPTGGLMGQVALINISNGISVTEEATVLANFSDEILHYNFMHNSPSLEDSMLSSQVVDNNGRLYEFNWPNSIDAVNSVLMKTSIENDFVIEAAVSAETNWIMTLPTWQYSQHSYLDSNTGKQCDPMHSEMYNRESKLVSTGIPIDTPPPNTIQDGFKNCQSTSKFSFSLFDEEITYLNNEEVLTPIDSGTWKLIFDNTLTSPDSNIQLKGLPIIGFSTQTYTNGTVFDLGRNVLANYAGLFTHKSNVEIEDTANSQIPKLMQISKSNSGQVLIFPFYTVKNNFNSLITVVNTTDKVKAIKLSFNEGKNSRKVFSSNIYLDAYDTWVGYLVPSNTATQRINIFSNDNTCAVPQFNSFPHFSNTYYSGEYSDGMGDSMSRMQEGFIEIIEMGTLEGDDAQAATHSELTNLPLDCQKLVTNWQNEGQWTNDPNINLLAPDGSGGLYGTISLINVSQGIDLTYDATAVINYSTSIQHSIPGVLTPNLSTGDNKKTLIATEQGYFQTSWLSSLDAITALFMKSEVNNDFEISNSINAQAQWINMYPTKQFYSDSLYTNSDDVLSPFLAQRFFEEGYGEKCESHYFKAYNREQYDNSHAEYIPIDPMPPIHYLIPQFCWSVNVSLIDSFETNEPTSNILDSNLLTLNPHPFTIGQFQENSLDFTNGWMKVIYPLEELSVRAELKGEGVNGDIHTIAGKPVIGLLVEKYTNGTLINASNQRVLANYGVVKKNKYKRSFLITSEK